MSTVAIAYIAGLITTPVLCVVLVAVLILSEDLHVRRHHRRDRS